MIRFHEFAVIVQSYMFLMSVLQLSGGMNYLVPDGANCSGKGVYEDVPEC
jgi:hypothetical protein